MGCSVDDIVQPSKEDSLIVDAVVQVQSRVCENLTVMDGGSPIRDGHQDVAENVFGFSRVYPGFRVIGNPGTGNPETGVFGGFRS